MIAATDTGLCRVPGCDRRWSVDVNHGRVCSHHDEAFSRPGSTASRQQSTLPELRTEPTGWWTELDQTSPHETGPDA